MIFMPIKKSDGNIIIGDNLSLNNDLSYNQIGYGNTPCILKVYKGNIIIGKNVGLSHAAIIAIGADVLIGNNTLIGSGTKIYSTDFHPVNYLCRRDTGLNTEFNISKTVVIGNDCFIGSGVIILKGVKIGDRSVVGAGSVVTKSIPSDCIAAGNPCVVVRKLKYE